MKRVIGILVVILALTSGAALAGPFYVGASVGQTGIKVSETGETFDANATSYKIYAGYHFLKFLGIEASYLDFGSPEDDVSGTDVTIKSTGYDAFVVGVIPIGDHFEIFGKYGWVWWDADTDVSGSGSESDSGDDSTYGAGLEFIIGKHFGIRGEYERYEIQDTEKVEVYSVGVDFRF